MTPFLCLSLLFVSFLSSLSHAAPACRSAASKFHFFNLTTPESGPCDLCEGPDGALWVQDILVPKIARIDLHTGKVDEYTIPYSQPLTAPTGPIVNGQAAFACAIRPGADGNIYASAGTRNQLVKINPKSKHIEVLTTTPYNALGDLQPFNDMWTGPHGMWFTQTTGNVVTYYEYATGKFTNHAIPTPVSGPLGLKVSNTTGDVWFCEFLASKMAKLDPKTGNITEYPLLDPALAGPAVLRVEEGGRYLYFTALLGNSIGRIDMFTGETKAYQNTIAPFSLPSEDTHDRQGNVWFSTWTENTLNKLDPATGIITTIPQPDGGFADRLPPYIDVPVNYGPGNNIWFADTATNRVGYYSLD